MSLKTFIQVSGFVLVAIGTIGLLLNEFVLGGSAEVARNRTLIFSVSNLVGLVNLAFSHFGMKQ
jgi:hypothetical protein